MQSFLFLYPSDWQRISPLNPLTLKYHWPLDFIIWNNGPGAVFIFMVFLFSFVGLFFSWPAFFFFFPLRIDFLEPLSPSSQGLMQPLIWIIVPLKNSKYSFLYFGLSESSNGSKASPSMFL